MSASPTFASPLTAPLDLALPQIEVRSLPAPAALRLAHFVAGGALACMFLAHMALLTFVDPDLWHETALAREMIAHGAMPLVDEYAYTPTVTPVVHHEWGTGLVLHLVTLYGGAPALLMLKYALSFGTAWLCIAAARKRGASWDVVLSIAPLTILCGVIGFTTIRAQLFTLFFISLLLYDMADLESPATDRDSTAKKRTWMRWLKWLPLYVVWLNLHAGFVVGVGILALHGCERLCRRRPVKWLIAAGITLAALVAINPYGIAYYPYLLHGLTMARPQITEWQPLWTAEPTMFRVYLASVLIVLYAVAQLGVRRMPGLLILAVCSYLAVRHTRHLSIYMAAWLCLTPGYLERTRLGATLHSVWLKRRRGIAAVAALMSGFCAVEAVRAKPWHATMPTTQAEEKLGLPVYPIGAVAYLQEQNFRGNLFTPFIMGGYCLNKLYPHVKVSFDGRYEVAYPSGMLAENVDFYAAKSGWQETLAKYPTDAVLVPRSVEIGAELAKLCGWRAIYTDATYQIFARRETTLPMVERTDAPAATQFP